MSYYIHSLLRDYRTICVIISSLISIIWWIHVYNTFSSLHMILFLVPIIPKQLGSHLMVNYKDFSQMSDFIHGGIFHVPLYTQCNLLMQTQSQYGIHCQKSVGHFTQVSFKYFGLWITKFLYHNKALLPSDRSVVFQW